jgi:pimeloyl-ACP methyl ester carboxylesterase
MPHPTWQEATVTVAGTEVHFYCGGEGPPLLLLHSGEGNPGWLMHHTAFAEHFRVYAPTHPGFGRSPLPDWITSVNDLAVFYLWMLDVLGLDRLRLLGHGMGGWLAAEMATVCPHVVDRLVLVDAAGLKPQHSTILDIFLLTPLEIRAATFHDPQQIPEWQRLYGQAPTPEDIDRQEAALETMVRLCWKPYMHNPRLPFLLPRLTRPTLIVWGRHDAIMPLECGEMYQRAIADARLETLDACGHCPPLERPQAFVDVVRSFLRAETRP